MRILEVGKFYPPVRGGMETVLATLCRGLSNRGHRLRVLVAHDAWPGRRESVDGLELRRLGSLGVLRSVALTPSLLPELLAAIREFEPDVVHMHLPHPSAGLAWLLARPKTPLVLSYHSDIVRQRWLGRLWSPGRRRLMQASRRILVSSDALLRSSEALSEFSDRCSTVPFGIESDGLDANAEERAKSMRSREGLYFLFVGRLVYYKGLEILLDAMADSPFRLVVAGGGPKRDEWEGLARSRGLGEAVRFLGEPGDDALRDWLLGCAALILPSTHPSESFGIVQLEAMAARRPVIAARASGGVESVQSDGETGFLVPARDPAALRAAMQRLWEDPALADGMGAAARARFDERYTADRMVRSVEAVLESSVEGGARS